MIMTDRELPPLRIKPTAQTPFICYSDETATFEMKGRSIPEDVTGFYLPVMQWFNFTVQRKPPFMRVAFLLEYFNTHSSRILLEILRKLEKMQEAGSKVEVDWYFEEEDDEMKDFGEDLEKMTGLPIHLRSLSEDEFDAMIHSK